MAYPAFPLGRAMRFGAMAALAVVLLAGCATPEDTKNPLLGYCPQWVQAPGAFSGDVALDAANPSRVQTVQPPDRNGTSGTTYLGRPLDMYRLRIDSFQAPNGTRVELRAYAVDANGTRLTQRTWRDFRSGTPDYLPFLTIDGKQAGTEFEVALTSIAQNDPPRPGPLQLAWNSTAPDGAPGPVHVAYTVTFHYKVCGAEL
jgi:hypothetical protein